MSATDDELISWLCRPEAYPERPPSVGLRQTHLSCVFLTPRHAYKLKKSVRFEFVNFSTPEARKAACEDELRLNRRMAPDVYLRVLSVTRTAGGELRLDGLEQPVDWLVQMRRLPDEAALDARIRQGDLTDANVQAIAQFLTEFYRKAPPVPLSPEEYPAAIARHVRANRAELLNAAHGLPANLVKRIHADQLRRLSVESEQFSARVAAGRVIDGHGDLRPEHVYLGPSAGDRPVVIDCLEFSPELRRVDVLDELAFLAMECDALGAPHVGTQVLETWRRAADDRPPDWLVPFYKAYRACVRAKVAALRADQLDAQAHSASVRQAERYLQLAKSYRCGPGKPLLVAIGGLMGSGKSTLARAVAETLGAEHLQTDALRQELLGSPSEPAAYGTGRYSPEAKARIYHELFRRAGDLLGMGLPVVLDATFLTNGLRRQAMELARQHAANVVLARCDCPREIALQRIARRQQAGGAVSEARPELYDLQAREEESPPPDVVRVDTTRAFAEQVQGVIRGVGPTA